MLGLKLPPLATSAAGHAPEEPRVLTSHGRLHGSLDHADQKLKALGILRQPRRKRGQRIRMASQVLQGHALSEVCLQEQRQQQCPSLNHHKQSPITQLS